MQFPNPSLYSDRSSGYPATGSASGNALLDRAMAEEGGAPGQVGGSPTPAQGNSFGFGGNLRGSYSSTPSFADIVASMSIPGYSIADTFARGMTGNSLMGGLADAWGPANTVSTFDPNDPASWSTDTRDMTPAEIQTFEESQTDPATHAGSFGSLEGWAEAMAAGIGHPDTQTGGGDDAGGWGDPGAAGMSETEAAAAEASYGDPDENDGNDTGGTGNGSAAGDDDGTDDADAADSGWG